MLMFVEIDDTLPWGANAKANNKSRSSPLGTFCKPLEMRNMHMLVFQAKIVIVHQYIFILI